MLYVGDKVQVTWQLLHEGQQHFFRKIEDKVKCDIVRSAELTVSYHVVRIFFACMHSVFFILSGRFNLFFPCRWCIMLLYLTQ